jgi:hypothetical protein
MKFVEPNRFTDADAAARKLVEIANAIEHAQDGRIYVELVNGAFLKADGTPDQYRAGIERAIRSAFPSALGYWLPAPKSPTAE